MLVVINLSLSLSLSLSRSLCLGGGVGIVHGGAGIDFKNVATGLEGKNPLGSEVSGFGFRGSGSKFRAAGSRPGVGFRVSGSALESGRKFSKVQIRNPELDTVTNL